MFVKHGDGKIIETFTVEELEKQKKEKEEKEKKEKSN
jgi:hypothetical protein